MIETLLRCPHACLYCLKKPGCPFAIAAGSGTAETPKAVECEASQSGPKGIAQPPKGTYHDRH